MMTAEDVPPSAEVRGARDEGSEEAMASEDVAFFNAGLELYFELQRALADDDLARALESSATLSQRLGMAEAGALRGAAEQAAHLGHASDIDGARQIFESLSEHVITAARQVSRQLDEPAHVAFCPMAFDNKGASWLQEEKKILNPYFGSKMLRCGTIRETFGAKTP
jgi:hypothetical protein